MYFDTHAHYDDEKLAPVRDKLLPSLFSGGVDYILNCATATENFAQTLSLTEKFPQMYGALGIHPSDCYRYADMVSALNEVERAVKENKKIVALGEIGLDYHYDFSPKDKQMEYFLAQLEIAERLNVPAVIHDRDAHGDIFEALRRFRGTAILHSCSESAELVRQYCRLGHYISFSGSVTFKNASSVREAARAADPDKLLIETDCPYLAPVPFRGKLNHSGYLEYTAAALAEARGESTEKIAEITKRNAMRLFGIEG